jgi:hypothetical protein
MYRAVPSRHGLAAVGNAFLLEARDRAARLSAMAEIETVANDMAAKWRAFCELASDVEPAPQPHALDGLAAMLLKRRGL